MMRESIVQGLVIYARYLTTSLSIIARLQALTAFDASICTKMYSSESLWASIASLNE